MLFFTTLERLSKGCGRVVNTVPVDNKKFLSRRALMHKQRSLFSLNNFLFDMKYWHTGSDPRGLS